MLFNVIIMLPVFTVFRYYACSVFKNTVVVIYLSIYVKSEREMLYPFTPLYLFDSFTFLYRLNYSTLCKEEIATPKPATTLKFFSSIVVESNLVH